MPTTLNEKQTSIIAKHLESAEWNLAEWRRETATENSAPGYVLNRWAKIAWENEYYIGLHKSFAYYLREDEDGIRAYRESMQRALESWTPCSSTCLLARLQGECELKAIKGMIRLAKHVGGDLFA